MASYDGFTLEGVKVGDTLTVVDHDRRGEPTVHVVEKVGRTLVHAAHYGRTIAFRIEDGNERVGPHSIGWSLRAYTAEGWVLRQAADALTAELRDWHLDRWHNWTPARMRAVLDALKATAL